MRNYKIPRDESFLRKNIYVTFGRGTKVRNATSFVTCLKKKSATIERAKFDSKNLFF